MMNTRVKKHILVIIYSTTILFSYLFTFLTEALKGMVPCMVPNIPPDIDIKIIIIKKPLNT